VTVAVNDTAAPWHPAGPVHSDGQLFALLRAVPGTEHVSAEAYVRTRMAGSTAVVHVTVETGDAAALHPDLARGRWIAGPGEIVVGSQFWHQDGLAVGRVLVLDDAEGHQIPEKIVGEQTAGSDVTSTDWDRFVGLAPAGRAATFSVGLVRGTSPRAYAAAVARLDPGLQPATNDGVDTIEKVMISVISTLTGMLVVVAALGVFNAAVMTTRERRRDLGVLKAIGLTPGQLVSVVVTAMGALGVVGGLVGLPAGMLAHRIVIPMTGRGTGLDLPASLLDVWSWPMLTVLGCSGVVIAALGAFLPSVRASRASASEVLRTE
jgi:putative ABC transport system permease protein